MAGTKLYLRKDVGSGPIVVLLHGLFGDGTQWEKITDILVASGHRVLTIDLLGHGKSPKPKNAHFNAAENVAALRTTLVQAKATKGITIVGYSMGGAVALSYSATYTDDIAELVIISTPFYLQPEQMLATKYASSVFITKASSGLFSLVERLLAPGKFFAKQATKFGETQKFHEMVGARDNKLDPRVVRGSIKNLVQHYDFAGELAKVTAPVTFYCGKKDSFIVQGQLYALKQFNPYIDIHRLDIIKVDHMLVQNLPKEIAGFITKNERKTLAVRFDSGTGEPLLLLHGIESSGHYWEDIAPVLTEHNRVIVLDLLGYGSSPKPANSSYSVDTHLAYIRATVQQLGLTKFAIAGHSLGAVLALAYAAKYPTNITRLTFISPVFARQGVYAKRFLLRRLNLLSVVADTGQLHPEIAKAIGDTRLKKLLPTVRSLQNVIRTQTPAAWAKVAANIPATFVYGTTDSLVDADQVKSVAKTFKHATITALANKGHNFALTSPTAALAAISPTVLYHTKPKASHLLPTNIVKHIARLAIPGLLAKSAAYICFGLLLFTNYAAAAITIGLALLVINKSYKIIRDSFSLKNEGLAYVSYMILGLFVGLVAYGLFNHPKFSLRVALFTMCVLVLLAGLLRVLAALAWTKKKLLRRSLLLSGTAMVVLGVTALVGSVVSIYILVYAIGIYCIARGLLYSLYTSSIMIFAFVRGFDKT